MTLGIDLNIQVHHVVSETELSRTFGFFGSSIAYKHIGQALQLDATLRHLLSNFSWTERVLAQVEPCFYPEPTGWDWLRVASISQGLRKQVFAIIASISSAGNWTENVVCAWQTLPQRSYVSSPLFLLCFALLCFCYIMLTRIIITVRPNLASSLWKSSCLDL